MKTKIILLTVSFISLVLAGCATCGSKACGRKASSTPIAINRTLDSYKVTIRAHYENEVPLDMFYASIALTKKETELRTATNGTIVFEVNQIEHNATIVVENNTNAIFCIVTNLPSIEQDVELNLTLKKRPTVQSHQ